MDSGRLAHDDYIPFGETDWMTSEQIIRLNAHDPLPCRPEGDQTRRSPAERQAWKVRLAKGLYGRGMDPEDVRHLFRFFDWVMERRSPRNSSSRKNSTHSSRRSVCRSSTSSNGEALAKGLLQGIEACLKVKFGAEGLELMPELRQIRDHELLGKVLDRIDVAASPDDLRRVWTRIAVEDGEAGVRSLAR